MFLIKFKLINYWINNINEFDKIKDELSNDDWLRISCHQFLPNVFILKYKKN
jgi:hypothetical protein